MQELKERVINEGYNKKPMDQQFSKVKTIDRNELKKRKKHVIKKHETKLR